MSLPDPRVGTVLQGRYKILERRTEGSMGVVYRGERVALGRPVAIKFLNEGYAATDDGRRRFEVEARAMSRLEHPNCVPVTDFGVDDGCPYLVMDFVSGSTLRQILRYEHRLAPPRAVALVRQVLAGVAHAHANGIIHRDLKPENVLVSPMEGHGEHARIVDFGLAKLRDEGSFTTGVAVGTPGYMSPEQTAGQKADERADLYAVGIILYELLTGVKPFRSESAFEVMRMHRETPPPPLSQAAPEVAISPRLELVLRKALEKSRDDRYATAEDFRAALEAVPEANGRRPGAFGARGAIAIVAGLLVGGVVLAAKPWAHDAGSSPVRAPIAAEPVADARVAAVAVAAPPDAAPPPDAARATADADELARLHALASHDVRAAIAGLETLRAAYPADPAVSYALGGAYARARAWPQAVQAYGDAVATEPTYQGDATLIKDVVDALGSDDAHAAAAALIQQTLGAGARPRLQAAAHSHQRALRARARELLARLR